MTQQRDTTPAAGCTPVECPVRRGDQYSELADALGCDPMDSHAARVDLARAMRKEIGQLRHALAQSGKLAEDRLQQMTADRAQSLRQRDVLRACQMHLACNAVTSDLVNLYERVREVLDGPNARGKPQP